MAAFSDCHCAFIPALFSLSAEISFSTDCLRSRARLVLFLEQRLALDLELDQSPLDLVDFLRQAVDFDPEPARGLVHQVDGLVRQEAVADVPIRQRGRRHQRVVGDPHPVVHLVAFLEPAQDGDRVGDARLTDEDRLEAPLERRVLFHVLAILVERGGTHHVQFAAGQRRLEQVAGVHGAFGGPRPDQGVHLVDEDDVPPFRLQSVP